MMSGHGANPIFFNKKMKIGCPEHSVTPLHPLRPITSYFRLTSPPPPQSGRQMCITPNLMEDIRPNTEALSADT